MSERRDPLRAAFDDYQRPPRDTVPRPAAVIDDLVALANSATQVDVTYYELTPTGVRRRSERATVTHPLTTSEESPTP